MKRAAVAAILTLVTAGAYLANGRYTVSGDTFPARYLPFSLLDEGDFDLDEFAELHDRRARTIYPLLEGIPYYLRQRDGHFYSAYTPGPALLALPIFAVARAFGVTPGSEAVDTVEKLAATLITALSVLLLFLALTRRVSLAWAAILAAVYGLGTCSFAVSSQALWQHGPSQLFLALTLFFLVRAGDRGWNAPLAALALGLAVVMRTSNLFVAAPVGLYLLLRHRRQWPAMGLSFLAPLVLVGAYYFLTFRSAGPAFEHTWLGFAAHFRQIPLYEGLYGVLLSPARGLFVYTPVALFAVAGAAIAFRRRDWSTTAVAAGAALVVLLVAKWFMWWGGHCWGPRLLADALPLICFLFHPLAGACSRRWWLTTVFLLLAVVSLGVQALGAFRYDGRWDARYGTDLRYEAVTGWNGGGPIAFYVRDLLGIEEEPGGPGERAPGVARRGIRIFPTVRHRMEWLIAEAAEGGGDGLELGVATDRPSYARGDRMRVEFVGRNERRPQALDILFLMRRPDGELRFFDGRRLVPMSGAIGWYPRWTGGAPTPYRFGSRFELDLSGWAPGEHSWYLLFTDPGGNEPLGVAEARFSLEP